MEHKGLRIQLELQSILEIAFQLPNNNVASKVLYRFVMPKSQKPIKERFFQSIKASRWRAASFIMRRSKFFLLYTNC